MMVRRLTLSALLSVLVSIVTPDAVAGFDATFDKDMSAATKKERMKACWLQTMAHLSDNRETAEEMAGQLADQGGSSMARVNLVFRQWMFSCYVNIQVELISKTIAAIDGGLEDVQDASLFEDTGLFLEATQEQQDAVKDSQKTLTAEHSAKSKELRAKETTVKEQEIDATDRMAEARAKLKEQMIKAQKAGLVTVKEMNEKLGQLGIVGPDPLVFEFSLPDADAVKASHADLNAKLRKMGYEFDELEKPEMATKNSRDEWTEEVSEKREGWPFDLRFTFHVSEAQAEEARKRRAENLNEEL